MAQMLVTGASGFIGSALCRQLESQGQQVFKLKRQDLYSKDRLAKVLAKVKPDYIYHLATYGNMYDQKDDGKIIRANVLATFNLLQASKNIPYKAFINVSSSSTLLPYETMYSATKASSERICRAFVNKYQKPITTVRPYSVYGPGDNPKHFIPVAINAFKNNLPMKLSAGSHDWIYIDDFVSAIIKVAEKIDLVVGQEVNIGTGVGTSNAGIIAILREIFAKPGNVERVESMREYDNLNWVSDNKLLKSLGWRQKHYLDEEIERMVYENSK